MSTNPNQPMPGSKKLVEVYHAKRPVTHLAHLKATSGQPYSCFTITKHHATEFSITTPLGHADPLQIPPLSLA
jgi:hypothetical protein